MAEYDMQLRNLEDLSIKNEMKNIIFLNKKFSVRDLNMLGRAEHFDIVLALNIIHWFKDWKAALNALCVMADIVIVVLSPARDKTHGSHLLVEMNNYVKNYYKGKLIGRFKRHTSNDFGYLYMIDEWCSSKKRGLAFGKNKNVRYEVLSNFHEKLLRKNVGNKHFLHEWLPGINFETFKLFNGVYPSPSFLKDLINNGPLKNQKKNAI
jgi:hypothetical protein